MMDRDSPDKLIRPDRKTPTRVVGLGAILAVAFVLFQILWPLRWNLVALWVAIEALFYTFYWRPRYAELNKQPVPHRPSKHNAMKAFRRCLQYFKETPDLDKQMYYSGWFLGAKYEDIKRGNAEEFVAYAFWYSTLQEMEDEGMAHIPSQMVTELEEVWGMKLLPGYTPGLQFMGHLWEPLKAQWRPLFFYMGTFTLGWFSCQLLARWGFEKHVHKGMSYFTLNMGNLGTKTSATSRSSSMALSDGSVSSAVDNMGKSPSGSAVRTAPIPEAAKSAKSSPPTVPAFVSANGAAAAATAAAGMTRAKSSPFEAAGVDWAAQLKAVEDSLAASITAASAVHGASVPIMAAATPVAAPAKPAARSGGWRSRLAGGRSNKQVPASSPALVPYLSTHTSVMLRNMPNPLDALESGLGGKDMPVLFLHGVGGLPAYLEMMLQVMALGHPLIVVQCTGVAMRLGAVASADEVVENVVGMLDKMGVEEVCVIGHSYGTFIAGRLARLHRKRVHSLCLIDPVCFGMFMPQLLANFLYNKPQWRGLHHIVDFVKKAGVYMASHELHVCSTFSRGFFWTDLNLWPEDMAPGSVVLLSGHDDLMDARQVQTMLERAGHIKVHYNQELTHGEFLIKSEVKQAIMEELRTMLARSGSAVVGLARPVLETTITLARHAIGASKVRLHTTKNGTRYVEDHTNKLVRTFTGNLTAVLTTMNTARPDSPKSYGAVGSPSYGGFMRSRFAPGARSTSKSAGGAMASVAEGSGPCADVFDSAASQAAAAVPGKAVPSADNRGGLSQTFSMPIKRDNPRHRWAKKVLNGATTAEAAAAALENEGDKNADSSDNSKKHVSAAVMAKHNVAAALRAAAAMSGIHMPAQKHRLSVSRRGSKEGGSRRSSGNGGVQFGGVEVIQDGIIPEGSMEGSIS